MAKFIVLKSTLDGGVKIYPMKEWLRQNPDCIPHGMDATSSTSRQLLSGLKKLGWSFEESDSEVRLFPPGEEATKETWTNDDTELYEDIDSGENHRFGLEKQLRDFLADNIESITVNNKNLKLFVDQTGRDGVEYSTGVGLIDVLGIDDQGDFYVFELKRDKGSDKVVGQVTRYMGWVKSTLGKNNEVFGVIVAKEIGEKLKYAASVVPNTFLYEYKVEFHLNEANEING